MADLSCPEPRTCTAAIFEMPGKPLTLRELLIPQLESHEALVKIECCTICGSDLHTVKGTRQEKSPSILGHESIGMIVELGSPPLHDIAGDALNLAFAEAAVRLRKWEDEAKTPDFVTLNVAHFEPYLRETVLKASS
jgi:hypothetical protein